MDLSINKINLNKKNLSFKGLEGAYSASSAPIMRFTAPPHKSNEKVYLEFAHSLIKDPNTNQYIAPDKSAIFSVDFEGGDTLEIEQSWLKDAKAQTGGFAYRFKIVDGDDVRYVLDSARSMKVSGIGNGAAERMNLIEMGRNYGVTPDTGTMYHAFKRAVKASDDKTITTETINHFVKPQGSMSGLNFILEKTDELDPYKYIMTTPDIGADKVSSHGYWPANHYQCNDLGVFKDFNFNMFKKGKGYVADGAFTSQGIQSPLVQHVLKWGKESPFYNWLKMDPNSTLTLGILPDYAEIDGVDPYEHIGVRLVNPKGAGYDKTKPTYIQFFDDRLLSKEAQQDGLFHFDNDMWPKDIHEITTHQDSVQPYAFEVDPSDKRLRAFGEGRVLKYKDIPNTTDFFTFPNFVIGQKNQVGGATCWDGNVDIIKMNLSNPDNTVANRNGFFAAREYIHGVADYWTETIQSHLILETAKATEADKEAIANANGLSRIFADIKASILPEGEFHSLVAKNSKTSEEIIRNFPLQTLETSEELSAIFAQPDFNEEFLKKTMPQVKKLFDSAVSVISDGRGEEYEVYIRKTQGNDILRYIYAQALNPKATTKGVVNLGELNKVTLKSLETFASNTPKEEKEQVISKLTKGIQNVDVNDLAKKIKANLADVTLGDFKLAEAIVLQGKGGLNWRFDAAKDIGDLDAVRNGTAFDKIWNGDAKTPGVQQFWAEFVERIKRHNPSAYIINEVTSLGEFCPGEGGEVAMEAFDKKLTEAWRAQGKPGDYELKPVYAKQVEFLAETSSTTTSEYSKGFNSFSKFAGVDPEHTMTPLKHITTKMESGDLGSLKGAMESLMKFNQPDSSVLSHMFVSNHDKPSVLHTMPQNMSIFMASDLEKAVKSLSADEKALVDTLLGEGANYKEYCPKAVGVGMAMLKTIKEKYGEGTDKANALIKTLQSLVKGEVNGKNSFKRAESFGVKPYEVTIQDLLRKSGVAEENLAKETLEFHSTMMKDSMTYYQRLWQVMNACVGTPTLYGGHEFAQTGYETPSKNEYLGIRNEILHGLKKEPVYKEYYEQMYATSNLYKQEGMSALRNGAPVSLDMLPSNVSDAENAAKATIKACADSSNGIINDGKLDYFAKQLSAYSLTLPTQGKRDKAFVEKAINDILAQVKKDKDGKMDLDSLKKVLKDNFGISENDANPDVFKALIENKKADNTNYIDIISKATVAKLDLLEKLKERVQIWPIFKKNSTGSEVISIVTNLGLPNGVASYEKSAKETVEHTVKDGIKLCKDGVKFAYELPAGYVLKRVGEEGAEYTIENGILKRVGDVADVVLKDTVTHFYKAAKVVL